MVGAGYRRALVDPFPTFVSHPREIGAAEVEIFLTGLAVDRKVSAATQNQALAALLFLYRDALGVELPWLDGITRAKGPERVPVVLSRSLLSIARLNRARSRSRPASWRRIRIAQLSRTFGGGFGPVSFLMFQGARPFGSARFLVRRTWSVSSVIAQEAGCSTGLPMGARRPRADRHGDSAVHCCLRLMSSSSALISSCSEIWPSPSLSIRWNIQNSATSARLRFEVMKVANSCWSR